MESIVIKRFARRKWGWYFVLLDRKHFKVKLLRFKCGGEISLQKHERRDELWLNLRGRGRYLCYEDEQIEIRQRGYIPCPHLLNGEWQIMPKKYWHHFLADVATWVLEIQYGERCDEGDIVRV